MIVLELHMRWGERREGGTRHALDKACQSVHGRLSGTQSFEEEGQGVSGH